MELEKLFEVTEIEREPKAELPGIARFEHEYPGSMVVVGVPVRLEYDAEAFEVLHIYVGVVPIAPEKEGAELRAELMMEGVTFLVEFRPRHKPPLDTCKSFGAVVWGRQPSDEERDAYLKPPAPPTPPTQPTPEQQEAWKRSENWKRSEERAREREAKREVLFSMKSAAPVPAGETVRVKHAQQASFVAGRLSLSEEVASRFLITGMMVGDRGEPLLGITGPISSAIFLADSVCPEFRPLKTKSFRLDVINITGEPQWFACDVLDSPSV